jgi:hypothetical protein
VFGSTVTVSAKAPDIVQESFAGGADENQVNLFLHQVTHNAGWRNQECRPPVPMAGLGSRIPQLALDLHYLLTAYGSDDWQAEACWGWRC